MDITITIPDEQLEMLAKLIAGHLGKADSKSTYTVTEAARVLRVSEKTIRRRVEAGTLAAVPCAGRTLIPAAVIEKLINPLT
ncbi:MAG: helix-turn-helix domain-containing protein [Verrucomicrobiota bacterium]